MKKKVIICLCMLMMVCTTSCSHMNKKVAVTTYPMQYLVERIVGDYIEVINISGDGIIQTAGIIDTYQEELKVCDVLFYINELEPYMDVYAEGIGACDVELINTAARTVQYKFERYTTTLVDGKNVVVNTPYYDDVAFNRVDVYKYDPIVWMDPLGMISSAEIIVDTLSDKYPELEPEFRKNFASLEYDLTALDVKYQDLKKSLNPISFVSMTPSFGPLQKAFGIGVYPVCLSKYGALPNETQLEIIERKILEDGVRYIIYEENMSSEMEELYARIRDDLYLTPITLSNLSSLTKAEKKEHKDYLTVMYDNLSILETMGQ